MAFSSMPMTKKRRVSASICRAREYFRGSSVRISYQDQLQYVYWLTLFLLRSGLFFYKICQGSDQLEIVAHVRKVSQLFLHYLQGLGPAWRGSASVRSAWSSANREEPPPYVRRNLRCLEKPDGCFYHSLPSRTTSWFWESHEIRYKNFTTIAMTLYLCLCECA